MYYNCIKPNIEFILYKYRYATFFGKEKIVILGNLLFILLIIAINIILNMNIISTTYKIGIENIYEFFMFFLW